MTMKYGRPSKRTEAMSLMADRPPIKNLIIQVDKSLHKKICQAARDQDMTIKTWVTDILLRNIN